MVIVSDNFNRANGGLGANWTTSTNYIALQIVSNAVEKNSTAGTDSAGHYSAITWPNDQFSEIQLITMNNSSCVVDPRTREAAAAQTFYQAEIGGPFGTAATNDIRKCVAGTFTSLGSASLTTAANDIWRLETGGSVTKLYQNAVLKITGTTDSTITSGNAGFGIEDNGQLTTDCVVDNWQGGDLVGDAQVLL